MKPSFDASKNTASVSMAFAAVELAAVHARTTKLSMKSSAKSCADDAYRFFSEGRYGFAHEWSCRSLEYSVGIMHPDYERLESERRAQPIH